MVDDAMKRYDKNQNSPNSGKPVDQEFWDFLTDEENRRTLQRLIHSRLPKDSLEGPEDIITRIKLKYLGEDKFRPAELNLGTLFEFSRRQVIDYQRERAAGRRGGGAAAVSLDELEAHEWLPTAPVGPFVSEPSFVAEMMMRALGEASQLCKGKQLMIVEALLRWLKEGCPTESWYEKLSPQAVEEFLALKKGKSLEGKISATFTKVKKILREIILREGLLKN
ncbi:hypothetical protein N9062_00330 [Akkermansiaceae bacterium]|nr:hypothetical protein [Akkermansiaceae bacterium]MDA7907314.1 hypothetical protein [Akkermansiaceae bacterium]MDB4509423.1 hypothetical protein [Akkermansiaceae bacterium]MDF1714904.1 hypothetical protein [Akkermansiaceae bacterium]